MRTGTFEKLFDPIKIGNMSLGNRIVMAPMSTNLGNPLNPGFVSEKHKFYYTARAKGGVGLIIIEATNVNPSSSARKFGLSLHGDEFISSLEKLVELIKEHGAKCAIQLNHSGRIGPMKVDSLGRADTSSIIKTPYFAVSPLAHPVTGLIPKQLSLKQLKEIMEYFVKAVKRAKTAGFDAVELHGAHGYLLNEFVSPYTNQRTDKYGGNFKRRCRFPIELLQRIKDSVGDDIALSYRISAVDGGLLWPEVVSFTQALQSNGVQVIHVSAGTNETLSTMNKVIPPKSYPKARLVAYTEKLKQEIKVPIIVVQRITTPELANEIIDKGLADLVAIGRPLIADPCWPRKAREGRQNEIRKCIYCNQGCIENIIKEKSIECMQNPVAGSEKISF
jgi:2,4-dienoyl-CoA reductase-like NADH-dependent reductase (Old Yellow Enzyme family)